jgi:hypothetical protein
MRKRTNHHKRVLKEKERDAMTAFGLCLGMVCSEYTMGLQYTLLPKWFMVKLCVVLSGSVTCAATVPIGL